MAQTEQSLKMVEEELQYMMAVHPYQLVAVLAVLGPGVPLMSVWQHACRNDHARNPDELVSIRGDVSPQMQPKITHPE